MGGSKNIFLSRAAVALIAFLVAISIASPAYAAAATIGVMPIDLKGDPPGPFPEMHREVIWDAVNLLLLRRVGITVTDRGRVQQALNSTGLSPSDLLGDDSLSTICDDMWRDGIVAIHIGVKCSKAKKGKRGNVKTYAVAVILYHAESGLLTKVMQTTVKAKKLGVFGLAAAIEKEVVRKGRLNKRLKKTSPGLTITSTAALVNYYDNASEQLSDSPPKAKVFRKMLHLDPENRDRWKEYLALLVKLRDMPAIEEAFDEIRFQFPDDAKFIALKAETWLALGKYENAIEAADDALRLDGENVRALTVKAKALFVLARYEETAETYKKLKDLCPLEEMKKTFDEKIKECKEKIKEREETKKRLEEMKKKAAAEPPAKPEKKEKSPEPPAKLEKKPEKKQ